MRLGILTITAVLLSGNVFAGQPVSPSATELMSDIEITKTLDASIIAAHRTIAAPEIKQQVARAVKQAELTYEIDSRMAIARQSLPTNQFKVIIGE